jgi:intergrase/recombinase
VGRAGFEPATFCASGSFQALNGEINVDWAAFKKWAKSRYAKSYAPTVYCYAQKFSRLLYGNLAELEDLSRSKRGAILRALTALSKYLGVYEQFKHRMKSYGLKWESQGSFESFLRIMRNDNSDVIEWVKKCLESFDDCYVAFIKFALISGLRKTEAIEAFNLVVELGRRGKLDEYYNAELESLEHFRYPKTFIRGSKNVFFSFIPKAFVNEIVRCHTISDSGYKRRRLKHGLPSRLKDLRDYYATFMLNHGLLREEIDLLQGRIGKSLFMKHYFSPAIEDLKTRTLRSAEEILKNIQG